MWPLKGPYIVLSFKGPHVASYNPLPHFSGLDAGIYFVELKFGFYIDICRYFPLLMSGGMSLDQTIRKFVSKTGSGVL